MQKQNNSQNQMKNQLQNRQQNPYFDQNAAQPANPYINNTVQRRTANSFNTKDMLTGALVGAAATYILTNENVQKILFKGIVGFNEFISGGFDELKERFEDAKAEYEAAKELE
jgi:hypothetical protein